MNLLPAYGHVCLVGEEEEAYIHTKRTATNNSISLGGIGRTSGASTMGGLQKKTATRTAKNALVTGYFYEVGITAPQGITTEAHGRGDEEEGGSDGTDLVRCQSRGGGGGGRHTLQPGRRHIRNRAKRCLRAPPDNPKSVRDRTPWGKGISKGGSPPNMLMAEGKKVEGGSKVGCVTPPVSQTRCWDPCLRLRKASWGSGGVGQTSGELWDQEGRRTLGDV